MDSATHFLSKNVDFNELHVTAKIQKLKRSINFRNSESTPQLTLEFYLANCLYSFHLSSAHHPSRTPSLYSDQIAMLSTPHTVDNIAPVVNCINDVTTTVTAGSTGTSVSWIEPTATDNSGIVSLTGRTHAPGSFFSVGTTQVTYTFTDGSGNSATCTFNVFVIAGT